MPEPGVDYAWQHPTVAALNAGGYRFVVRYLSYDATKNLTAGEARTLAAAGIPVVSNWEFAPGAAKNGYSQGVADATEAARQHTASGGPAGRPIYFSVDYDIPDAAAGGTDPAAKLGAVADYFRGVASVIGVSRAGAYGGYWAIKRLFDAGLIVWGWQTYAWSGGLWDGRAQLRQTHNGVLVGGADADVDEAQVPDFGQWTVGGPAPAAPSPAGVVLAVDGVLGPRTISTWQQRMGTPADGVIGTPSPLVRAVQSYLNHRIAAGLLVDGVGIRQDGRTQFVTTRSLQRYLGTPVDGVLSLPASEAVKALQRRLNGGAF